MEILIGWLVLALVIGALARALYTGRMPEGAAASLIAGGAGLAAAAAVSELTGVGRVSTPGEPGTWLAGLTFACVVVAAATVLGHAAATLRPLLARR